MKLKIEINERKFKQFIKKDQSTGKNRLIKTKSYIAKYFGIHPNTLRNWMKREGYGYLVGVLRGRDPKPIASGELNILEDNSGKKMVEWPMGSGLWQDYTKEFIDARESEKEKEEGSKLDENTDFDSLFELKEK